MLEIAAAANRQDAAIFLTAAFTGHRTGELLALEWRDVDLAGRVLGVRGSWSGVKVTLPKLRSVPIAPRIAEVLSALRPVV